MTIQVAVIGAGIVGVQIARTLRLAGHNVSLFDKNLPGMATSYGNAGFIASDEIFPLAHGRVLRSLPRMVFNPLSPLSIRWQELARLFPWFVNYARACSTQRVNRSITALASLQAEAAPAWRRVIKRDAMTGLVRESGAWKLFESERGFRSTQNERDVQRQFGIACHIFAGAEVREQIPELATGIKHGVFYPAGMSVINSLSVTQAIVSRFIEDGGVLHQAEVTGLDISDNDRIVLRLKADAAVTFDKVIIACGHLSGKLLEPMGYRVPMVAERGYHLEMSHQELSFDMPVGLHERGFYMTPMTSGLRLAGTTEFTSAGDDPAPNWKRAVLLRKHAEEILPGVTQTETGRWMGHRPTLYDFLPVLGQVPRQRHLYCAFGHHHLGLTLSAISAEIMAEIILGKHAPVDLKPFSLARFQ